MRELSSLPPGLISRSQPRTLKYAPLFRTMKKDTWYELQQGVDFQCKHNTFIDNFRRFCKQYGFTPFQRVNRDDPEKVYIMYELWGELGGKRIVTPDFEKLK